MMTLLPGHGGPARVLVLGGGYAGVRAALALARDPGLAVSLVDRTRLPARKTRLHELDTEPARTDLEQLLEGTGARRITGEIESIDLTAQHVRIGERRHPYDWLVVALGSRSRGVDVPGAERAFGFDGAEEGAAFARAVEKLRTEGGRLAVVGAGPTGVEAACEAAYRLGRERVTLIELEGRVLPGLDALPAFYARARLAALGVELRLGARVRAIEPGGLLFASGEPVPAQTVVLCIGTEPSPLLAACGLAPPGARARVDRYLVAEANPRTYVIGDCARPARGEPPRPSAQLAVQQGDFVGADLARRRRGEPRRPFEGRIQGEFVSLGGRDATGHVRVGPLRVPAFGPTAWLAKQLGELRHDAVLAWRSRQLRT